MMTKIRTAVTSGMEGLLDKVHEGNFYFEIILYSIFLEKEIF